MLYCHMKRSGTIRINTIHQTHDEVLLCQGQLHQKKAISVLRFVVAGDTS